ncbi:MAG: PAS domain-containing protein [Bacteroidia bacterium]|nr:PAS domain-containing protein [Bacteroidia bacterium]
MNILTNSSLQELTVISGEEQLHILRLFQHSLDPLCVAGFDGFLKIINPAFTDTLGYSEEELLSSSFLNFIHPEDQEKTLIEVHRLIDMQENSMDFVSRFRKKNEDYVYFQWNAVPDRQNQQIYCTFRNITDMRIHEMEKRRAVEDFNLIVRGIDAGIWSHDLRTGREWWSSNFFKLLDYEPGEIHPSYAHFKSLVHPSDRAYMEKKFHDHLYHQKDYKVELRLLTGNGEYKWMETSGQSIRDDEGNALRVAGSLRDINDRKMAQLEVEKQEFLLNQTAKMARVGGWEICLDKMTPIWSEEVYRIHEVEPSYKLNLEEAFDFYVEEYRALISDAVEKAINEGKEYDLELKILTKKNQERWVRAIGKPIKNDEGEVTALRGIFQDIEEQKRRENSLNKSIEIISEQNKRFSNFAYIVSHNLRSHISNFTLLIELYERTSEKSELDKILDMGKTTFSRLKETIDHLSKVVEIQTEISQQKEYLGINRVLNRTLDILSMDITQTGCIIETDFNDWNHINYVPAYLDSIFQNLISNAIKYRHPDRNPHIKLRTYFDNGKPVLSVKDNGLGIDLKLHKEKVFGMFKTFHEHPQAKGIGLFITKNQIEALGGFIQVESEVGIGTEFIIYLQGL